MTKTLARLALGSALLAGSALAALAANPIVGGAPMFAEKNIIENAVNSADHTTLVAAVQAAGLVETLHGPGPFTVFAPDNAAFEALPAGTVATLLEPENKQALTDILTYHVVPGRLTTDELKAKVSEAGGAWAVATVNGGELTFRVEGDTLWATDAKGQTAAVTIADVIQSNGVIHGIDTVLLPM